MSHLFNAFIFLMFHIFHRHFFLSEWHKRIKIATQAISNALGFQIVTEAGTRNEIAEINPNKMMG